jgi:hypothetical protein
MSDYNSNLPVKLRDGNNNIVTSQANGTQRALDVGINVSGVQIDPRSIRALTSTDVVTARLNDGSGNSIGSTGGALNVNISSGSLGVGSVDRSTFTYGTSLDQVVGGVYQDTSPTLTAGQSGAVRLTSYRGMHTNLRDSSGNELLGSKVSASSVPVVIASDQSAITVAQATASNLNATVVQSTAASLQSTARLNDGSGNAITSQANGTQRALDVGINVSGVQIDPRSIRSLTSSDIVSVNLRDNTGTAFSAANPLPTSTVVGGSAVSLSNPLPVYLTTATGTAINDYKTASSVASGSSDDHDYTVTAAKTLHLSQIYASASGRIKVLVKIETGVATNTFTTVFAAFNSTASPNINILVPDERPVAAGVRVRVTVFNLDDQAMDLYSTISGNEQP